MEINDNLAEQAASTPPATEDPTWGYMILNGLIGPKGDKGDKGDRGEPGHDGKNGDKGDKGDKGEPGHDGKNGDKGDKGDKGEPGHDGKNGDKGDKGDKGEPGHDGKNGDKGDKGDKGEPGHDGKNGDKGDKGDKGEPGHDGKNGDKGDKGDKGEPGHDGKNGDKGDKGDKGEGIIPGVVIMLNSPDAPQGYQPTGYKLQASTNSGLFDPLNAMPNVVPYASVGQLDNLIVVSGGGQDDGTTYNTCKIFNTDDGSWTNGPAILNSRQLACSASLTVGGLNQLFLLGGAKGGALRNIEVFDKHNWHNTGHSLHTAVLGAAAVTFKDYIFLFGGSDNGPLSIAQLYEPKSGSVGRLASPPNDLKFSFASAVAIDTKAYIIGGVNEQGPIPLLVFDMITNSWTIPPVSNAPQNLCFAAVSAYNGKIYVMGGFTWDRKSGPPIASSRVYVYHPAQNLWTDLPVFLGLPRGLSGGAERNGSIYVLGGSNTCNPPGTERSVPVTQYDNVDRFNINQSTFYFHRKV